MNRFDLNRTSIEQAMHKLVSVLHSHGLKPSRRLHLKGYSRIHRYHVEGDKQGSLNGWFLPFPNGGMAFGSWKEGKAHSYHPQGDRLSQSERLAFERDLAKAKQEHTRLRLVEQQQAAQEGWNLYQQAKAASPKHEYLQAKGIQPPLGVRQSEGCLRVPMLDAVTDGFRGLQNIDRQGVKRFSRGMALTGCYLGLGELSEAPLIALVEGMATGASVHQVTGWAVACSFTASNLLPLAKVLRARFPAPRLVVCADNDHLHPNHANTGLEAGTKAAKAVGGLLLAPPPLPKCTDWNDFQQQKGTQALAVALLGAVA